GLSFVLGDDVAHAQALPVSHSILHATPHHPRSVRVGMASGAGGDEHPRPRRPGHDSDPRGTARLCRQGDQRLHHAMRVVRLWHAGHPHAGPTGRLAEPRREGQPPSGGEGNAG
ncbi:unnamed protein product, partial [Laminaria digitata]